MSDSLRVLPELLPDNSIPPLGEEPAHRSLDSDEGQRKPGIEFLGRPQSSHEPLLEW